MSFTAALYEGDSVMRSATPTTNESRTALVKDTAPSATPLETAARDEYPFAGALINGGTILFDVVWGALKSVAIWIEEKSRQAHYRRIEDYLAQSTDLADLERRIRQLERANQSNWIDRG